MRAAGHGRPDVTSSWAIGSDGGGQLHPSGSGTLEDLTCLFTTPSFYGVVISQINSSHAFLTSPDLVLVFLPSCPPSSLSPPSSMPPSTATS